MSLRLLYEVVSGNYPEMMKAARDRIARTATATMREAAARMKTEGRAATAGLGSRFSNALQSKAYPSSGVSLSPAAVIYSKIPYAGVFEEGATIAGRLWLPIEANLPLQARGKRWTPKDFVSAVGPLRSGRHGGKPLLFGQVAIGPAGGVLALPSRGIRARKAYAKARKRWLPVFVGVSSVTDPKKFDITAVVANVNGQLGEIYAKNWGSSDNG